MDAERADIERRLEDLEQQERDVSLQRRRLHDRLALYPDTATEHQRAQERELSARRRELHAEIDQLRRRLDEQGAAAAEG